MWGFLKREKFLLPKQKFSFTRIGSESMKTFLNAIKKYFVDFGTAVAKGDIWCKLSLLVMGAGYWGRKHK